MQHASTPLRWRERTPALAPSGLVASGPVARTLLLELARRGADALQGLSAVVAPGLLVLLGEALRLPWVDGIGYCAPAPEAPGLWLPTRLAPELPPDLVHASLRRRTAQSRLLLWHAPACVLGLDEAQALQPEVLAWLEREFAPCA